MTDRNGGRPKRVALVIGSGAVKCAAALGLWKVLRRENIRVDMLVGCSGGSIYAAAMALGFGLEECVAMTKQLWDRNVTAGRNLPALLRALFPGLLKFDARFGMLDDTEVYRRLSQVFEERTFAEAQTSLSIAATDFYSGEQVVLTSGRLVDAIRASISLPYIWQPWRVGDRLLIDGSASNPLPIDIAIKEGAGIILAMGFESAYPRKVKSVTRFAFQINSIMTNNLFKANFAFHNLAHHAEILPILPEFDGEVGLFDSAKIPHVIAQGEQAMAAQIPYLHKLLDAE